MATYLVHFTSTVQSCVPIEADSERDAMELFDDGKFDFADALTVYSETGGAEYAEPEED